MTHRTFISIIVAAALAVTGMTSTPARADGDDLAKWIAGAVALGLIGAAIADQRRDDRAVTRYRGYDDHGHDWHGERKHKHKHKHKHKQNRRHGHDDGWAHRGNRFNRHVLPGQCRRVVQTRRGEVRGFGRRCLLNNYAHFNALPHQCAVRTKGHAGARRVIYQSYCLRQHGYRVSADHR